MSIPSADLAEIAGKVDAIVRDLQAEREQRRRKFPVGTQSLLTIQKVFGESARMLYVEENGYRYGRMPT